MLGTPYRIWNKIRNNGDGIGPHVVELVTGSSAYYGSSQEPHVLPVGSTAFMANNLSVLWGTGFIGPHVGHAAIEGTQIRALRGRVSADYCAAKGIKLKDIPFGDPGIFAKEILDLEKYPRNSSVRKVAVIPHHSASDHPYFLSLKNSDEICLVDICDNSMKPIRQIEEADIVISQSLHGLIYAESFGKKVVWVTTDHSDGWKFKFKDYFSTTQNTQLEAYALDLPIDTLAKFAERNPSIIDKKCLRESFPFELIRPDAVNRHPFRECRKQDPLKFSFEVNGGNTSALTIEDAWRNIRASYNAKETMFSRWAEKVYSVGFAAGTSTFPTPKQLDIVMYHFDRLSGKETAVLVPTSNLDKIDVVGTVLSSGVIHYPELQIGGDIVLHRPLNEGRIGNYTMYSF